jgi:hypothetical protein
LETDLIGVARFLDKSEDLPGEPFNGYIELKQLSDDGRVPAKRLDPSDFDFPVENFWPFEGSQAERNPV